MTQPSQSEYKLFAYNTSFVNDCHENQFHPGLSESASIIAKTAVLKYDLVNNKPNYQQLINLLNTNVSDYKKLINETRSNFGFRSTHTINNKLNSEYDFLALIEQSMHVPTDNVANYDEIMVNKLDLTILKEQNENYGILKRIHLLNQFNKFNGNQIVDVTTMKNYSNANANDKKYRIVYDNVVNPDINAGEGIAIIYKSALVENPLTWTYASNPAYQKIIDTISNKTTKTPSYNSDENLQKLITKKSTIQEIHFYSDDLGPAICKDVNGNPQYVKITGAIDNGRPFIMTGGTVDEGKTLNLFVAAHGPNVMNLFTLNTDGKVDKPFKTLPSEELTVIFDNVHSLINKCIQNGINAILNKNIILENVNKVNVFLGGDFNDPRGLILEKLLSNKLTLKLKDDADPIEVSFSYNNKRTNKYEEKIQQDTSNITDESLVVKLAELQNKSDEYGYPELISGCANTDSLKGEFRKVFETTTNNENSLGPKTVNTLGLLFPTKVDNTDIIDRIIDRINYINNHYPDDFFSSDKFGYNGDYALFGSNNVSGLRCVIKVDNTETQQVKDTQNRNVTVIASDHLPVISTVYIEPSQPSQPSGSGGRKSRRNRGRQTKRNRNKQRKSRKNKRRTSRK